MTPTDMAADAGLALVNNIINLWETGSDSLIDYTRVARVEPVTLIDSDCMMLDNLKQILETQLCMFAGYYLQAVSLSATVGNVQITKELGKFNPHRSPGQDIERYLTLESYEYRLPMDDYKVALEASKVATKPASAKSAVNSNAGPIFNKDSLGTLREESNLAVGKQFNVEITRGEHKANVPINIRLQTMSVPTLNLLHILSIGSKDTSFTERWHQWRSGQISFIKDLCLCQDLIDDHRNKLISSKDNIYSSIMKTKNKNFLSAIFTGSPSVATASNLVVVSEDTIKQLEREINGKFSDFNTRQKVFKETYLMIVAVVDKEWGQVTFYHRGIPHPTELDFNAIKSISHKGPDVSDILKAYKVGHSPTL